jgi:hypothetical protein
MQRTMPKRPDKPSEQELRPDKPAEQQLGTRTLLEILGQDLRKFYEVPRDLPHKIFTGLMSLKDRAKTQGHSRRKSSRTKSR